MSQRRAIMSRLRRLSRMIDAARVIISEGEVLGDEMAMREAAAIHDRHAQAHKAWSDRLRELRARQGAS